MMNMDLMGGSGWLGMAVMWVLTLLPLGLIVGTAWLGATTLGSRDRRRSDDEAAALLRRRLAAGEIDAAQYAQARAALGLSDTTQPRESD